MKQDAVKTVQEVEPSILIDNLDDALQALSQNAGAYAWCTRALQLDERCVKKALQQGLPLEQVAQEHLQNDALLHWFIEHNAPATDSVTMESFWYTIPRSKIDAPLVQKAIQCKANVARSVVSYVSHDRAVLLELLSYDSALIHDVPRALKDDPQFALEFLQCMEHKMQCKAQNEQEAASHVQLVGTVLEVPWGSKVWQSKAFKQKLLLWQVPDAAVGWHNTLAWYDANGYWTDVQDDPLVEHALVQYMKNVDAHCTKILKKTPTSAESLGGIGTFIAKRNLAQYLRIGTTVIKWCQWSLARGGPLPVPRYVLEQLIQMPQYEKNAWLGNQVEQMQQTRESLQVQIGSLDSVEKIQALLERHENNKSKVSYDFLIGLISHKALFQADVTQCLLKHYQVEHFKNLPDPMRSDPAVIQWALKVCSPSVAPEVYSAVPMEFYKDAKNINMLCTCEHWHHEAFGIQWIEPEHTPKVLKALSQKSTARWSTLVETMGEVLTGEPTIAKRVTKQQISVLPQMPSHVQAEVQNIKKLAQTVHWLVPDVMGAVSEKMQPQVIEVLLEHHQPGLFWAHQSVLCNVQQVWQNTPVSWIQGLNIKELLLLVQQDDGLKKSIIQSEFKGIPEVKQYDATGQVQWNFACLAQYVRSKQWVQHYSAKVQAQHLAQVIDRHVDTLDKNQQGAVKTNVKVSTRRI